MITEIAISCYKVLFCLVCMGFGLYFGQATYKMVHKKYIDVCNYTKRVILRMVLFTTIMNLFFLLTFGELNTVGVVSVYSSLMVLCSSLCDLEECKKISQWAIRLAVVIEIICTAFIVLRMSFDNWELVSITVLGLVITIISIIVSELFEKR